MHDECGSLFQSLGADAWNPLLAKHRQVCSCVMNNGLTTGYSM